MSRKTGDREVIGPMRCGHCHNTAPMEIVANYSGVEAHYDEPFSFSWDMGEVFKLLLCPSCKKVMLQEGFYHSEFYPDNYDPKIVWPKVEDEIKGLPENVDKAYRAAIKVRGVDTNAYAVLLRRVLEIVCIDRSAEGKTLHEQLIYLAEKDELPSKLGDLAKNLRLMGNIGAHATVGDLSENEVPYLDALCRAVLEYIYSAPKLLEEVEKRVTQLKMK